MFVLIQNVQMIQLYQLKFFIKHNKLQIKQMTQSNQMNRTFIPKEIIRKSTLKNQNNLLKTHQFQKTAGNPYIEFQPFQVKFNGYQISKNNTAVVKIINKAPIPQRVHILPPTQPGFSIKTNKKGSIAAGMSQNIVVTFNSEVYKYQYDVIKINTQTQNFVVPIYAYPSIPKLREVFPKIIDFGTVQINCSESNIYPIENIVPIDFQYQFQYISQSSAFIITPIKGIILSSSTENIQITFVPSEKCTYTADALLHIKQFDFQPIRIKLMGSGKQKKTTTRPSKRIKSSRLHPISSKQLQKIPSQINQQSINMNTINLTQNKESLGLVTNKKSFIRSKASYPKLLKKNNTQTKNISMMTMDQKIETNIKKQNEKQYLNRFSRITELDKQKQVKFAQYLGDHAMNEEDLQFETSIMEQFAKTRLKNLQQLCVNRAQNQMSNQGQIQYAKYVQRDHTWDMNKNDQLKLRKQKLQQFMNAGSKIIEKYRLEKRLKKIKQFLYGCQTREDVIKKVQQDYQKSLDSRNDGGVKMKQKLTFNISMIQPASFSMHFGQEGQSIIKDFQTEGSPDFDDFQPLSEIQPHQTEKMNYGNLVFPSDFINLQKLIPQSRHSGQQQLPFKSATLPSYQSFDHSSLFEKQLHIPTHHFISNNYQISRLKNYHEYDQKTSEYLYNSSLELIEDEFEGWSKGDIEVLRAKFQRNLGCQFSGISQFKYNDTHDVGFTGELGSYLPKQIGMNEFDKEDIIQEQDSDQQKMNQIAHETADDYLEQIEQGNNKAKEKREDINRYSSFQNNLYKAVDRNLMQSKMDSLSKPINKIQGINKYSEGNCKILI